MMMRSLHPGKVADEHAGEVHKKKVWKPDVEEVRFFLGKRAADSCAVDVSAEVGIICDTGDCITSRSSRCPRNRSILVTKIKVKSLVTSRWQEGLSLVTNVAEVVPPLSLIGVFSTKSSYEGTKAEVK
jgi:hypothetical protein